MAIGIDSGKNRSAQTNKQPSEQSDARFVFLLQFKCELYEIFHHYYDRLIWLLVEWRKTFQKEKFELEEKTNSFDSWRYLIFFGQSENENDCLREWEREGELAKTETPCTHTHTIEVPHNQLLFCERKKYFYCDIENNTNKGVK